MSPSRRTALIAGLWFAGTFVFSIRRCSSTTPC
jgi:hypothetical protein